MKKTPSQENSIVDLIMSGTHKEIYFHHFSFIIELETMSPREAYIPV